MPLFSIYREDYEAVTRYLSIKELKHAPEFNILEAPEELQKLLYWAYMPRGAERSKYLNDFAKTSWDVPDGEAEVLLAEDHLNAIRHVNRYLRSANYKLKDGGYLVVAFDTAMKRRVQFFMKYSKFWANFLYFFDFLWHRVCPKLWLTRRFYYLCTSKVRKVFTNGLSARPFARADGLKVNDM